MGGRSRPARTRSQLVTAKAPPRSDYHPRFLESLDGRHVIVLGADGFIGSHVVRAALAAGGHVDALCIKDPWRLRDLAEAERLRLEFVPEGRWWEASYSDALSGALDETAALVLLAYEPPASGPEEMRLRHELDVNAAGTARIAAAAADSGCRAVFTSSADVYGPWHTEPVSESATPRPVTPYAHAKLEAERLLARSHAVGSAVSLRLSTVFGLGEDGPRAIPSFVRALARGEAPVVHGEGADVRDYVHVSDVAGAIVNACVRSLEGERALNVGSGTGRTTLDILNYVKEAMKIDREPRLEPANRPRSRLVLEIERARSVLSFAPNPDFAGALREEVRWLSV